jgi:putative transposase
MGPCSSLRRGISRPRSGARAAAGSVLRLPLSQRVFRCGACGLEVDRDLNAALNLRRYGLAALKGPTGSSPGSDACGDPSGGGTAREGRSTSHGSMKQEAARHEFHPRRVK